MKFLSSLLSFLALTAITAPAQAGLDNEKYQQRHLKVDQRALDAVKDHHHSRMALLKDLIEERRQSLEDHQGGRRLLADEDLERTSRQLVNFRRKLAYMEETNSEEHHMERIVEMQNLEDPSRLDNMAVQEKLGNFNS